MENTVDIILDVINKKFPKSVESRSNEEIPVFFTDVYDLGKNWD